jgi:phospholipase/lecithinase/hemolysin
MRAPLILCAALLAGCATQSAAPPGAQVPAERLQQTVVTGQTSKAQLLAAFGPTKNVRFDSGFEAWVYQSPAGDGRFAEFVVLIDPTGVVAKTRTRAPASAD